MLDSDQNELLRTLMRSETGEWLEFREPVRVLTTFRIEEVLPIIHAVEAATQDEGYYAAGFIAYEAAPAFDSALSVIKPTSFPLIWFGIFKIVAEITLPRAEDDANIALDWQSSITPLEYRNCFDAVRCYIHDGDTYQVNFSYRLTAGFDREPFDYFIRLIGDHASFAAFIETKKWAICSASPELYFKLEGDRIESRPMKGTTARGLWFEQDQQLCNALADSEKDRAENVMIVDMVRNDLGRIAEIGSVQVTRLFDIEKYPTVWQMTSTVRARTLEPLHRILCATFPAASITGAPKRRTMEIITELESTPRNLYTGAIGFVLPKRRAQFNVAIRTVLIDKTQKRAEYGIGGGIVWDSQPALEFEESRIKAAVLTPFPHDFELLETILWRPESGFWLLTEHLKRLAQSADYFGFKFDVIEVRKSMAESAAALTAVPHRLRLTLSRSGVICCQSQQIVEPSMNYGRVAIAAAPINSNDRFLYHKTTHRVVYERALAQRPGYDDVLLYNEERKITESTIANVAVEIDGRLCTPPVRCGLLAGTLRAHLLRQKQLTERIITVQEAVESAEVYLLNSVKGMHRIELLNSAEHLEKSEI